MAEGLAGLMGAYGSDEEDAEQMEELEAGGQVTILGTRSEDEQGADLSHLTTAAAQAEPDTAGTQPGTSAGPAEGPAGPPPEGGGDGGNGAAAGGGGEAAEGGEPGVPPAAEAPSILPPEYLEPPSGECNAALQAKVAMWLKVKRERGRYINQELRHSRGYRNPEFFRKMVEHLEIDEIGSSFAPEVFNPHGLPKEDYLEELQKEWAAEEERRKAQRAATGRIEFASAGFAKSGSQPQLAHNPLLPGLNLPAGAGGGVAAAIDPLAAVRAAQAKAAALAAAVQGQALQAAAAAAAAAQSGAASGAGKSSKWDAGRR